MLFGFFTDLFNRVLLRKNIRKTVSMVCRTYHTPVGMSEAAYEIWTAGVGKSYQERLRKWVQVP